MSSVYVRDTIKTFLAAEIPSETVIDLTAQFAEMKELISDLGIAPDAPWLGLEFIGDDEAPITVPATNAIGKYREMGAVHFHVVSVATLGVGSSLLTRGEALRDLFRGRRIGNIAVQSVTPMNFGEGATLKFEGGYMSGSFILSYECDLDL
jgi:hypothetical protein